MKTIRYLAVLALTTLFFMACGSEAPETASQSNNNDSYSRTNHDPFTYDWVFSQNTKCLKDIKIGDVLRTNVHFSIENNHKDPFIPLFKSCPLSASTHVSHIAVEQPVEVVGGTCLNTRTIMLKIKLLGDNPISEVYTKHHNIKPAQKGQTGWTMPVYIHELNPKCWKHSGSYPGNAAHLN
jgi:hypothetical protein